MKYPFHAYIKRKSINGYSKLIFQAKFNHWLDMESEKMRFTSFALISP